ncbi:MAG: hypothetical protein ACLFSU_03860 [Acholeplasmataceae bacterium]
MTFEMWSAGHYLFILLPFVLLVPLYLFTQTNSCETNRRIGIYIMVLAILILFARNFEIWVRRSYRFDIELLPLQICHFANFVLLIGLIRNKQTWLNFALILNLPAAMVSIIFANSLTNYSTLVSFRAFAYIMGHAILVTVPLWLFMLGFIRMDRRILKKTLSLVSILYLASILVNNAMFFIFGQYANYFYTMKPQGGTPLETFYEMGETLSLNGFRLNIVYVALTAMLGLTVMVLLYSAFYRLVNSKKRARVCLANN